MVSGEPSWDSRVGAGTTGEIPWNSSDFPALGQQISVPKDRNTKKSSATPQLEIPGAHLESTAGGDNSPSKRADEGGEAGDDATIERILLEMAMTDERRHEHKEFIVRLDGILKKCCGRDARVDAFGSTVSGFATRDSDLDITLNPGRGKVRRWHVGANEACLTAPLASIALTAAHLPSVNTVDCELWRGELSVCGGAGADVRREARAAQEPLEAFPLPLPPQVLRSPLGARAGRPAQGSHHGGEPPSQRIALLLLPATPQPRRRPPLYPAHPKPCPHPHPKAYICRIRRCFLAAVERLSEKILSRPSDDPWHCSTRIVNYGSCGIRLWLSFWHTFVRAFEIAGEFPWGRTRVLARGGMIRIGLCCTLLLLMSPPAVLAYEGMLSSEVCFTLLVMSRSGVCEEEHWGSFPREH